MPIIKKHWPVFLLLVISAVVCALNYTPGTWLSGWDTLHPEFNFGLNFERTINGVFRVEQGLGAVAAHSIMGDLPWLVILYISHFFLPQNFLRYSYIFLNLIVGPLGMYFLLQKHFLKKRVASFLGALFYLLNVGTMQIFNVPFEMFTTLYATLPFVFYFAISFLEYKERRIHNLFYFVIWVLFTAPAAYAATLWYVFFICFFAYFFLYSLLRYRHDKKAFRNFFVLIVTLLSVNFFWLVPNIYFILGHGAEVANANINLLFSDQAFLKNKEFGNVFDILLMKSFYFDWQIYAGNNQFVDLLRPWIEHLNSIPVLVTAYLLSFGAIIGAIYQALKLKAKSIPIFAVLLICFLFLFNDNFPFSLVFSFFQNHVPFFREALRFPDDKILNIYVFVISVFFGYFCLFVLEKIEKIQLKVSPKALFTGVTIVLLVYYMFPAFSGNFINYYMRINIPNQYFELFNYLNTQPASLRVANFPVDSPWGWVYYDWNRNSPSFQGAGFLYFGIKQPLLDRDFDRWSPYNESYYREVSYAVYKEDKNLLADVIKKYKIGYIFVDKSVVNPQNPSKSLYFDESEKLIRQTGLVTQEKTFGTIDLFKLNVAPQEVEAINTDVNVSPKTTSMYDDVAYSTLGNYVTGATSAYFSDVSFPFRNLINNQSRIHSSIASIGNDKITLSPAKTVTGYPGNLLPESFNTIPANLVTTLNGTKLTLTVDPILPTFDNTPAAFPASGTVDVPSQSSSLFVSVNGKDLFSLGDLTQNTPVIAGKTLLDNGDNSISFFDQKAVTPISNTFGNMNPFFSSCSDTGSSPTAGFTRGGIKLTGQGPICIIIPYGLLFPSNFGGQGADILSNFSFSFSGSAGVTSCLYDIASESCLSYLPTGFQGNKLSFTYPFNSKSSSRTALKVFISPPNDNNNSYFLSNFSSSYSESVASLNISKSLINSMFNKVANISFSKLYIPKNVAYNPGVELTNPKNLTNDCNPSQNEAKKEIVTINGARVVKYTSTLGSFCDHFSYPNLPHNQGYLVILDTKTQDGLPLTLCVSDYTARRCDIYVNLTATKNFAGNAYLLPPMDANGIGYDINLENLGIKGSPSVNYLSSVEFIPIPYSFLENIKSQTLGQNPFGGIITNFSEYDPDFYLAKVSGPTVLTLNESFEAGFKAYYVDCGSSLSCAIKTFLAPFYSSPVNQHILVDNWANGWVINSPDTSDPNAKIAIVFLPQYLEYLGFALLIFIFGYLILHIKTKRS